VGASGVQGAGALVDQARNEAGLIKVGSCKYSKNQKVRAKKYQDACE
jgi:hypothetical protein